MKHVHQGGEEVLKEVFCFLKCSLVKEGGPGIMEFLRVKGSWEEVFSWPLKGGQGWVFLTSYSFLYFLKD